MYSIDFLFAGVKGKIISVAMIVGINGDPYIVCSTSKCGVRIKKILSPLGSFLLYERHRIDLRASHPRHRLQY